jgi:membrane associated rhomboid family serine protease
VAHIGGFVAGALLIVPLRRKGLPLFDRGRS